MKSALAIVLSFGLTILCWGVYGPLIQKGQREMAGVAADHSVTEDGEEAAPAPASSRLRPFVCVGLAYFLIAVLVPVAFLYLRGESGHWAAGGIFWSLAAGAAGSIGALGIIFAFAFRGQAVFVMPLVFGGAPVINSFVTMFLTRTSKRPSSIFLAGLIMVILGAVTVLVFKPGGGPATLKMTFRDFWLVLASLAVVIVSWGAYGPILHKGQLKMAGSRLRPLICVGLAYFAIAVVVPLLLLQTTGMEAGGNFNWRGSMWSLAAGAAGAIGALGIIMAFAFGGRPVYVMPLVFGGAPVVNTLTEIVAHKLADQIHPLFYSGLILVVAGAAMVLVFAPKAKVEPAKAETPEPEQPKVEAEESEAADPASP